MASFFGELRRRNVVRVAVAYAIVGWLLIEVASVLMPTFLAPEWVMRVFSFFVIAGFPVALILSWAYDLTPDGIERTRSDPLPQAVSGATGRKLDFAIIGTLILALGFVVYNYESEDAPASNPEAVVDEAVDTSPVVVEERRDVLPNSIAVLPLESISPDPSDAYFAVGIHEEILRQLAKIRDLNVIARTSVLGYPASGKSILEIADELNVEMVMEGSVRIAGDDVRVTVQLIDGATNTHLWTEVYPGTLSDIFAIQADIATRIAMALEAELLPSERESIQRQATNSTEAYGFYLRAMTTWGNDLANIATP
ncbi:MAG: adenylyl cyclase, partial [Gammaproteobacteria bacterium]